ncbi:hypothetical protein D7V80_29285 [Corallococcus sp. CA054B]|uniref:hypothetical protein n=1 Tax=Corallococcus sp. CA054B TaxID=2316734 RepID=UPI000EA2E069|nr:hypothetical protein [Corallococcus sp. CA054B]RKG63782.1 hypothetical protein D7V80_29285 [Corallococcus sp. CA054B]
MGSTPTPDALLLAAHAGDRDAMVHLLQLRELAERLSLDPAAVKSRLHRARVMIREYLLA